MVNADPVRAAAEVILLEAARMLLGQLGHLPDGLRKEGVVLVNLANGPHGIVAAWRSDEKVALAMRRVAKQRGLVAEQRGEVTQVLVIQLVERASRRHELLGLESAFQVPAVGDRAAVLDFLGRVGPGCQGLQVGQPIARGDPKVPRELLATVRRDAATGIQAFPGAPMRVQAREVEAGLLEESEPFVEFDFRQRFPEMHVFTVIGAAVPRIPGLLALHHAFSGTAGLPEIEGALIGARQWTERLATP